MNLTLKQLVNQLNLKPISDDWEDTPVISGYASDLLSDVLAKGGDGCLWITNQKHQNIVGVAVMVNLVAVVITGGISPDDNTLEKAKQENIPLFTTDASLFDIVGKLYELGIRSC
jgi:predicted transcriptional regulator